jgi:hypothetical protein
MQKVLQELGLDIGHEEPGKDGVIGWQHLMPNHPWTLKALRKGRGRRKVYMMQLQHPVPTINSIAAMYFRGDWPPIPGGLPVEYMFRFERNDTPVIKAMRFYYHLNELGLKDQKFMPIYLLEDIHHYWKSISETMGFPGTERPTPEWDRPAEEEMEKYPNLEWRDICEAYPGLASSIARLSDCMGYDVGEWKQTELSQWANAQTKEEKENESDQSGSTGSN